MEYNTNLSVSMEEFFTTDERDSTLDYGVICSQKVISILKRKDWYLAKHSKSVRNYSIKFGKVLGISQKESNLLDKAALFHDMGKILIPLIILNKPGSLSPMEWEIMRSHAALGEDIIKYFGEEGQVGIIIRHHHENYDGSGYPDGISGERIPLLSRIISVTDVYDALTSDRPYRKAYDVNQAINIMKNLKYRQLDPDLTELFINSVYYD